MRDLYAEAYELFTMVWQPSGFSGEERAGRAMTLVDALKNDFHRVGEAVNFRREDPVMAVTLNVTERLLASVSRDLKEGRTDYAHWRLRGFAQNCVTCHTRTSTEKSFLGAASLSEPRDYLAAMPVIEFLVASRRFDEASERLFRLAEHAVSDSEFSGHLVPTLRFWLLLEIRALDRPWEAAEKLSKLSEGKTVDTINRNLLAYWIKELRKHRSQKDISLPIDNAEKLLKPVRNNVSVPLDDKHLVSTLRASKILHDSLAGTTLVGNAKAKAYFLLALSYQHLNIPAFEATRDLFLERCIRAFPGTPEAKEAFRLYEWDIRQSSTGSGGIHLDDFDKMLIRELEKIAGAEPPKT